MAITVNGLNGDFYYSNNPIFLDIEEGTVFSYFTIKIGDFNTIRITPLNNRARVDISSYIKSLFPILNQDNNLINTRIEVSSWADVILGAPVVINTTQIDKYFLKAGKRTNETNIQGSFGNIMRTSEKTPFWAGFPVTESSILIGEESGYEIAELPVYTTGRTDVDIRKVKGCNSTFVKFLNSLGGYSYWLFEGVKDNQKNTNLGTINNNVTIDLGNNLEQELELYSKVPKDYFSLIQDLIISPEIYIYRLGESGVIWDRYFSNNNSLDFNPAKNAQEVKVKLKPFTQFNPSLLW